MAASRRHARPWARFFATVLLLAASPVQARTGVCRSDEPLINEDFEITCLKTDHLAVEVVCKSSSPGAWDNLPSGKFGPTSVHKTTFRNCSFPPGLSLLNVTRALGATTNYTLEIDQARTRLRREHLRGFYLSLLYIHDSSFDLDPNSEDEQLPGDMLRDLRTNDMYAMNLLFASVPRGFFEGASKLRNLTIRDSGLRRIGRDDFAALENLRELMLFRNAIEEIESGSFDKLTNLGILDLSHNKLRTLPSDVFHRLVRLERLHLTANEFDELPGDLLRIEGSKLQRFRLNYNRGRLRSLPPGFFRNLSSLNYVELTSNNFTAIPGDVFLGASSLATLHISNNSLTSLPAGLFEGTSLVEVWASENRLTSLPEGLFDDIYLEKLYLNENLLANLTRSVLSGLNNLQILELSHNNLSYIEPHVCKDLGRVQIIDLSYNQLDLVSHEIPNMESFSVLLNCVYIENLNLSHNRITRFFDDWNMDGNLKNLNLEGNKITHVTVKDLQMLNSNAELNLNNNQISTVDLEDLKSVADEYREKNKISKNTLVHLKNNPLNCDCQLLDFFRYFEGKLDPEVYTFITIESKDLKCTSPHHLQGKLITTIPSEELRCQMAGNETTSDDACSRNCTCWRIPGKKVLSVDCSYSNLTSVPPMVRNPYDWSIELNMSGNHLRSTPRMNVSYLANVTTLDLSFNNISQVTRELFGSEALRVLKLHNNSISRLDYYVVQHLYDDDLLTNLTLHGNPYICDCGTRDMLNFVQKKLNVFGLHKVTCRENNRRLFEMTINELCDGMIKIIIFGAFFCAGCIAFIGIFAAFYFKYKMKIKVWLYSKQWCLWFVTEDELDKDKLYDAFISFSHKDEEFVEKEIVAKLEEGPMPYKLCLHYRDWLAGEWIPAQIARSVDESRRTIVIMSPNFLESVWGRMEFRTAHNQALTEGRARVIVVLYGDIGNTDELDSELKAYLSMNTYLKWGDPWFWDKLRYALPHRYELSKKKRRSRNARIIEKHMSQMTTNNHNGNNKDEIIPMPKITAQSDSAKLLESNAEC